MTVQDVSSDMTVQIKQPGFNQLIIFVTDTFTPVFFE